MKKAIVVFALLFALMPLSLTAHAGDLPAIPLTPTDTRIAGDVNGDKTVDLRDVTVLTRYLAGGWNVTINEEAANVNGDQTVDLRDVAVLRRYLVGGWGVTLQ